MKKLNLMLLLAALLVTRTEAQQKSFDQPVQLKSCHIEVTANRNIASTIIEMEFYNPQNKEVEGYRSFQLNNGQVITDFHLELNGKYREGSIDEKWKANRAYSQIVGKKIDPAILQMDYLDHYSLRIYPIAAYGSRKIKFTISQVLETEPEGLTYRLPLQFQDSVTAFSFSAQVTDIQQLPRFTKGLITSLPFQWESRHAYFDWESTNIRLNKSIEFVLPVPESVPQVCVSTGKDINHFLLNLRHGIDRYYSSKVNDLAVYWDVSRSSAKRNRIKELDYLKRYMIDNEVKTVTIHLFNEQLVRSIRYNAGTYPFERVCDYLFTHAASGATNYDVIEATYDKADAIILFSDGFASWGSRKIIHPTVPVTCVISGGTVNYQALQRFTTGNGGSIINLDLFSTLYAVKKTSQSENYLFGYFSSRNSVKINEQLPMPLTKDIRISGNFRQSDTLFLQFGNSSRVNRVVAVPLSDLGQCDDESFKKWTMHKEFNRMVTGYNWSEMLLFGLRERVVTLQTSYLVLERVEDYIKYNIAPPKDLVQKCAELNYVYKSEFRQNEIKKKVKEDELQNVVNIHNNRIRWWDPNESLIIISKPETKTQEMMKTASVTTPAAKGELKNSVVQASPYVSVNPGSGGDLKEVVVTGAFGTKRAARSTASFVQNLSGEQLNLIRSSNINNALAGKVSGVQVRSQSAVALGREVSVRLRGENGLGLGTGPIYVLDGTIMPNASEINPDDIEDLTVLQGPSATALFGPEGINGAIVLNSKKGRRNYSSPRWAEYKLSMMEDVDYMLTIKEASLSEITLVYEELKSENENNAAFYFDMADLFFEKGLEAKAYRILLDGVEESDGSLAALKAAAYILEKHRRFDAAIMIYKNLLATDSGNLVVRRELALAYYQANEYQLCLDTYHAIVLNNVEGHYGIREVALDEMNAVIAAHKESLDLSKIELWLLKALPIELKITVESNYGYVYNMQVIEPGGEVCNSIKPNSRSGGRLARGSFLQNTYQYDSHYWESGEEYLAKKAESGKYRLKVDLYGRSSWYQKAPEIIRIISFKKYQQTGQALNIENVFVDNQYGVVEIGEVKW